MEKGSLAYQQLLRVISGLVVVVLGLLSPEMEAH